MAFPTGLNHVAMSVPSGTLTDSYRSAVLDFYGQLFGWREIESLRLADRLTLDLNGHGYLNVRERPDPMVCSGYEHYGIVVEFADEACSASLLSIPPLHDFPRISRVAFRYPGKAGRAAR